MVQIITYGCTYANMFYHVNSLWYDVTYNITFFVVTTILGYIKNKNRIKYWLILLKGYEKSSYIHHHFVVYLKL